MTNINSVVVSGNLTRDADVKYTESGMAIAEMAVAVNKSKKVDDSWKDEVSFVEVKAFGYVAEKAGTYATKGARVVVMGELKQDTWEDKEGKRRSKLYVIANRIEFSATTSGPAEAPIHDDDDKPF